MRLVERIAWFGQAIAALALGLLTLHVAVDVVAQALGRPIRGTTEIAAELYMPAIVFGALAMVQRRRDEIRVDLIALALPARANQLLDRLVQVLVAAVALWLAWQTGQHALRALNIGEAIEIGLTTVPIWPGKAMLPLGLTALAVAALARAGAADERPG
ncbi:MAG: TRAP transporter small permease subunit [Pseudomonadota bacterium]